MGDKVYSPSRTEDYLFCPVYYQLKHTQGWQPATYGKPEIAMAMGRGIGAGLSAWYSYSRLGVPVPPLAEGSQPLSLEEAALRVGLAATDAALAEFEQAGRTITPYAQEDLDQLRPRVLRAIPTAIAQDPIPKDWTILGTEITLPDHGYARIDMPVRDPVSLAVVDFKTKLTMRKDQVVKERQKYQHHWKSLQYCWGYGEAMSEPVTRYWIYLVVIQPKLEIHFWPYEVHPEHMAGFVASARQAWDDMDAVNAGLRVATQRPWHFNKDGYMCDFYAACYQCHLDEGLMVQEYVKVSR